MENELLNWEAPQIITVNPEQTEAGIMLAASEGAHSSSSNTLATHS